VISVSPQNHTVSSTFLTKFVIQKTTARKTARKFQQCMWMLDSLQN
jgi:hypothetical protein